MGPNVTYQPSPIPDCHILCTPHGTHTEEPRSKKGHSVLLPTQHGAAFASLVSPVTLLENVTMMKATAPVVSLAHPVS